MKPLIRGLVVAALHAALVLAIGAKVLTDRATLPRAWARAVPGPGPRFEGRYARLRIVLDGMPTDSAALRRAGNRARLEAREGRLVGHPAVSQGELRVATTAVDETALTTLAEPVTYFVPEGAPDPFARLPGEELWVEVTVPGRGSPRPIQLGLRRDSEIMPLGRP